MEEETKRHTGSAWVKGRDVADIAKLVRLDIADAVRRGALPAAKYAVRISRYSMGRSLSVTISDVRIPGAVLLKVYNESRLRREMQGKDGSHDEQGRAVPFYSEPARQLLQRVEDIVEAYNKSATHGQSDYYENEFHSQVEFDHRWTDAIRERQIARLREAVAAGRDPAFGGTSHASRRDKPANRRPSTRSSSRGTRDRQRARYTVVSAGGSRLGRWLASRAEAVRIANHWARSGAEPRVIDDRGEQVWPDPAFPPAAGQAGGTSRRDASADRRAPPGRIQRDRRRPQMQLPYGGAEAGPLFASRTPPAPPPPPRRHEADRAIAETILQQMGGRRALVMIGANRPDHILVVPNGVRIQLPRNSTSANRLTITLQPSDTYRVRLHRDSLNRRTFESSSKTIKEYDDIYADQLREVIERATGLYLSMGTMGRDPALGGTSPAFGETSPASRGRSRTVRQNARRRYA